MNYSFSFGIQQNEVANFKLFWICANHERWRAQAPRAPIRNSPGEAVSGVVERLLSRKVKQCLITTRACKQCSINIKFQSESVLSGRTATYWDQLIIRAIQECPLWAELAVRFRVRSAIAAIAVPPLAHSGQLLKIVRFAQLAISWQPPIVDGCV